MTYFCGIFSINFINDRISLILPGHSLIISLLLVLRRAHTESTKEWLNILAKENVPVLICLSFADKLYAELMGGGETGRDVYDIKDEIQAQLKVSLSTATQSLVSCSIPY